MKSLLQLILVGLLLTISSIHLGGAKPVVISERIQNLGKTLGVSKRFQDNEDLTSGQYTGLLAAVQVTAEELARRNGRETWGVADGVTAFWLWCWFPPNKPPPEEVSIQNRLQLAQSVMFDENLRKKLNKHLGIRPVKLAQRLHNQIRKVPNQDEVVKGLDQNNSMLERVVPELSNEAPRVKDFNLLAVE